MFKLTIILHRVYFYKIFSLNLFQNVKSSITCRNLAYAIDIDVTHTSDNGGDETCNIKSFGILSSFL
jgi:hypothetical protein